MKIETISRITLTALVFIPTAMAAEPDTAASEHRTLTPTIREPLKPTIREPLKPTIREPLAPSPARTPLAPPAVASQRDKTPQNNGKELNQEQIDAMEMQRRTMWNATGGGMIYR